MKNYNYRSVLSLSLLILLFSTAHSLAKAKNFVDACGEAISVMFGPPTNKELCMCAEKEAKNLGATKTDFKKFVDLYNEGDPKKKSKDRNIQKGLDICLNKMSDSMNKEMADKKREKDQKEAEKVNKMDVKVNYLWWMSITPESKKIKAQSAHLDPDKDEEFTVLKGVRCKFSKAEYKEEKRDLFYYRSAVKTITCSGADIAPVNKEQKQNTVGCSSRRDGFGGGGVSFFDVTKRNKKIASILLRCSKEK